MRVRHGAIALAVLAVCVTSGCSGGVTGYGRDTQGAFMETCVHKEQQPEQICRCTYDEITQRIPFDRYVEIDKELQKDPKAVPDEILSIVSDCGSRLSESSSSNSSSSSNDASS
jgi:hypothetical protein